jgi:C-terminal processing protease CtpA/Prc
MPARQATAWSGGTLAKNPLPTVNSLPRGIGYISVPAYSGGDAAGMREYAQGTHALLAPMRSSAPCGWVLDLRQNGGGNMWPMLAGLKPFLGSTELGSFAGPKGGGARWVAGRGLGVEPADSLMSLESAPVAVLIGPRTASSGEAVGVAFHGRPRTRFFGQSSAGLANGNSTNRLPDGAMIMVMSVIDIDRNGQKFGEKIEPDEVVAPPTDARLIGTMEDPAVIAATRWLFTQTSCGK